MTTYKTVVLQAGNAALINAIASGKKIQPARFRVGTAINYNPTVNNTDPLPGTIFTGGRDLINIKIIDQDTIRYSLVFPEFAGNFSIGNIILDMLVGDQYIPTLCWVSDVGIPKERYTTNDVGNRVIISFDETFRDYQEAVSITVTPPVHASLAQYPTQLVLDQPQNLLYQAFVIQNHTTGRTPAIVVRRPQDNRLFGTSFMQRLESPYFGYIHGAFAGDGYAKYQGDWLWGGWFISPSTEYIRTIDGGFFQDTLVNNTYQDADW